MNLQRQTETCKECGSGGVVVKGRFRPLPHVTQCHISDDLKHKYEEVVCPECSNHYVEEKQRSE